MTRLHKTLDPGAPANFCSWLQADIKSPGWPAEESPAGAWTPRSVIRGALSSGLKPREVAKLLKVPIGLVQAVVKDE